MATQTSRNVITLLKQQLFVVMRGCVYISSVVITNPNIWRNVDQFIVFQRYVSILIIHIYTNIAAEQNNTPDAEIIDDPTDEMDADVVTSAIEYVRGIFPPHYATDAFFDLLLQLNV